MISEQHIDIIVQTQKTNAAQHLNIMGNMKKYDQINKEILKSLPNPSKGAYEIKVKVPERHETDKISKI